MSTAAPRQVHLYFLLGSLILMGLVAGERATASITCYDSSEVCNVVDETGATLAWSPSTSGLSVHHYAVEISWDGGVFELNPSWADLSPSDSFVTITGAGGHYFQIRALACNSANICSSPSNESFTIAFYEANAPGAYNPELPVEHTPVPSVPDIDPGEIGDSGSMFFVERWSTQQSTYWSDQRWVVGDFDGDGRPDIAKAYSDGNKNTLDIHRSTGNAFYVRNWIDQKGNFRNRAKWFAGDFNGDGYADMGRVVPKTGMAYIDIFVSNGSEFRHHPLSGNAGTFSSTQKWLVGDFNGDGRDDLAKVFDDRGQTSIDVFITGTGLTPARWATRQGAFDATQRWLSGDFDGDGRDDLSKAFNLGGQVAIDAHLSTGSHFETQRWAENAGTYSATDKWLSGEFNGDGRDDMLRIFEDELMITIEAYPSLGSTFSRERWATQQGVFDPTLEFLAGDYNEDGTHDIAVVENDGGRITIDVYR